MVYFEAQFLNASSSDKCIGKAIGRIIETNQKLLVV